MRQEVDQLLSPLSAEAAANLENGIGDDGLPMMLASGFARLSIDLKLEVAELPLDDAGDAGATATCLRAKDTSHFHKFALDQVKNGASGAEVNVHVRRGQMDVIGDETKKGHAYRMALRKRHLLHISINPDDAPRKSCLRNVLQPVLYSVGMLGARWERD